MSKVRTARYATKCPQCKKQIQPGHPIFPRADSTGRTRWICAKDAGVKGHWRTYTEEAPLIGEHVGTFWFSDHKRVQHDSELARIRNVAHKRTGRAHRYRIDYETDSDRFHVWYRLDRPVDCERLVSVIMDANISVADSGIVNMRELVGKHIKKPPASAVPGASPERKTQ